MSPTSQGSEHPVDGGCPVGGDAATKRQITRDGQDYDFAFRSRMAAMAVKETKVDQPSGIDRPPGPNGKKVVFNAIIGRESLVDVFAQIQTEHERIAFMKLGDQYTYVLTAPELILEVFQTNGRQCTKGKAVQAAKAVVGDGLLTSDGDHHLRQRRMIQPAFHSDRITEYADDMTSCAVAHEDGWSDGQQVNMAVEMSALTLAVVGKALFASDLRGDAREFGEALEVVMENFQGMSLPGAQLRMKIPTPGVRDLRAKAQQIDELVADLITQHRESGFTGDLLGMMIAAQEDGFTMDDAQLRDEAMTLVLAGHETTAMALTWAWYLLDQNPEVAVVLRAELDEALQGRAATAADLPSLPFTYACIAEGMRMFPPFWIIGRRTKTEMQVDDWTLPAGSSVIASPYALGRDERLWPEPNEYRPSRWIDENSEFSEKAPGQPRGAWIPFGFGSRRCIGEQFAWTEAAIVLATLAQRWEPELDADAVIATQGLTTLRPKGGMPMTLRRRGIYQVK